MPIETAIDRRTGNAICRFRCRCGRSSGYYYGNESQAESLAQAILWRRRGWDWECPVCRVSSAQIEDGANGPRLIIPHDLCDAVAGILQRRGRRFLEMEATSAGNAVFELERSVDRETLETVLRAWDGQPYLASRAVTEEDIPTIAAITTSAAIRAALANFSPQIEGTPTTLTATIRRGRVVSIHDFPDSGVSPDLFDEFRNSDWLVQVGRLGRSDPLMLTIHHKENLLLNWPSNTVYHATTIDRTDSIERAGLWPGYRYSVRPREPQFVERIYYVYAGLALSPTRQWATTIHQRAECVIFPVNVQGLRLLRDPCGGDGTAAIIDAASVERTRLGDPITI